MKLALENLKLAWRTPFKREFMFRLYDTACGNCCIAAVAAVASTAAAAATAARGAAGGRKRAATAAAILAAGCTRPPCAA
jgi:hypothetical protein